MRIEDLDYDVPEELIAQEPAAERDASRLLVLERASGRVSHRRFGELPSLLRAGDVLVVNDSRVVPARFAVRRATGGQHSALFLRRREDGAWEVLLDHSNRLQAGAVVTIAGTEHRLRVEEHFGRGLWRVRPEGDVSPEAVLEAVGVPPLPPYIRRPPDTPPERIAQDRERYQTVYARRAGSVAAPTAGLHFTPALLDRLRGAGVEVVSVTLHVGLGTFRPITTQRVEDHEMHAEWYEVTAEAAERINETKRGGGRVVAVGTTAVRTLETAADERGDVRPGQGWTRLFILPGYRFRVVDALITNFHQPRTTLLALVCALAGRERILAAYQEAIRERYRLFSYGDAMLIV